MSQINEERTMLVLVQQLSGYLKCQARLANTSRPSECYKPCTPPTKQRTDLLDFTRASDQRCWLCWQ